VDGAQQRPHRDEGGRDGQQSEQSGFLLVANVNGGRIDEPSFEEKKVLQLQGSISPTFYTKLLCSISKIPKAQKNSDVISVFLLFWDLHA